MRDSSGLETLSSSCVPCVCVASYYCTVWSKVAHFRVEYHTVVTGVDCLKCLWTVQWSGGEMCRNNRKRAFRAQTKKGGKSKRVTRSDDAGSFLERETFINNVKFVYYCVWLPVWKQGQLLDKQK